MGITRGNNTIRISFLDTVPNALDIAQTARTLDGLRHFFEKSSALTIAAVGTATTPLFMILLGQFSVFSLDIAGKPGVRTLSLACIVYTLVVVLRGICSPRKKPTLVRSKDDRIIALALIVYFVTMVSLMCFGNPSNHVSTGVHQEWSPRCGEHKAYDIMGFERDDTICDSGPTGSSQRDYVIGTACGHDLSDSLAKAGVSPGFTSDAMGNDYDLSDPISPTEVESDAVEWYSVCGVTERDAARPIGRILLLAAVGTTAFSSALELINLRTILFFKK